MAIIDERTETILTLKLSSRARARLQEQAANTGQDISAIASEMIEKVVGIPSVEEIMDPVRRQVAEHGMNDSQLSDLFRSEIESHRREKKAKSA
ncbi:MAG: hypothetical protein H7144_12585 [Burkholderiales bacterium]|nr:hypothetical protein [Phycisphaerae bacterium]